MYNPLITSYTSILVAYQLKVFALSFLRNSNTLVSLQLYNTIIKLEVISKSKMFTFLS